MTSQVGGIRPAQQQRILGHPVPPRAASSWEDARPQASVDRATCVPDQADTEGRQRTTTVTIAGQLSWPSRAPAA
jgi:hypothetical protein